MPTTIIRMRASAVVHKRSRRTPPSKDVAVQLLLRTIRRLHLERQVLNLGRSGTAQDLRRLNVGQGIEIAHEDEVRAKFVDEYQGSVVRAGWMRDRHYEMEEQVEFQIGATTKYWVDLVGRRFDPRQPRTYPWAIGPVELKRVSLVTADAHTGQHRQGRKQVRPVAADIKKLVDIAEACRDSRLVKPRLAAIKRVDKMHPHILVWGSISEPNAGKAHRTAARFMREAFSDDPQRLKGDVKYAWMPLDWQDPPATPSVLRWLWIAYAEIRIDWKKRSP